MSARVLTSSQLAASLGRGLGYVEGMLDESERQGVVERVGNGWRLTDVAERRFGAALRELVDEEDDE